MISVEEITFAGEDERGVTGEIDSLNRGGKFILAYRVEGSISGNHYHKGLSEMKAPEVFFLLEGAIQLYYGKVEEEVLISQEFEIIEAPAKISIQPFVWHQINFLEDSCFLELNSFAEGDKDTFRLSEVNE